MLFLATIIYLAVFFSPGDIGYKFVKLVPIYATICTIKEVYRALKITKGLKEGSNFKSGSLFIPLVVATIKVLYTNWPFLIVTYENGFAENV